jgi:hypothetical protein
MPDPDLTTRNELLRIPLLRLSEKVLRSVLITKLAGTQHQNQVVFVPFLDL